MRDSACVELSLQMVDKLPACSSMYVAQMHAL